MKKTGVEVEVVNTYEIQDIYYKLCKIYEMDVNKLITVFKFILINSLQS